jgi:hypothetical protein
MRNNSIREHAITNASAAEGKALVGPRDRDAVGAADIAARVSRLIATARLRIRF